MNDFRYAIIGAAKIADKFCDAVSRIDGCVVAAVASKSYEKAKAFAEEHNIEQYFDSYEAMLDAVKPDAVYIATTPNFHYANCMLALEKNVPVLCEKAMFLTEKQAREVFEISERKNIFVMEAMWSRFLPAVKKAREWIQSGRIGNIVYSDLAIGFNAPDDPTNRYFCRELGGGAAFDITVYGYEITEFLINRPIERVTVECVKGVTNVDDTDIVILRFDGGGIGIVKTTFRANTQPGTTVYGSNGRVFLPDTQFSMDAFLYDNDGNLVEHFADTSCPNGFVHEIKETVRCVRENRAESPVVPHRLTIDCAKVLERCGKCGTVSDGEAVNDGEAVSC